MKPQTVSFEPKQRSTPAENRLYAIAILRQLREDSIKLSDFDSTVALALALRRLGEVVQ